VALIYFSPFFDFAAVDVLNLAQWANAATLQCFADGNGVTCLSWSTGRFEPPTLVVGGSHPAVYRYTESSRQWSPVLVLPPPAHGDVRDVAWAPNVGRRFHYIASCEGQQVRIFKLARGKVNGEGGDALELEATQTMQVANAWRCQWNVTGTVLAVGGDCGVVRLYKADPEGSFKFVSKIQGDLSQVAVQHSNSM
jgi:nucleoporin SEH1